MDLYYYMYYVPIYGGVDGGCLIEYVVLRAHSEYIKVC